MPSSHGALVVFGSGPGVGRNVAALFAIRGFGKVILMSRDADRLGRDAAFVRSANPDTTVHEVPVDLGNTKHVQDCLKIVSESLMETPLECVLFNAARTGKSEFFEFEPASLENDLRIAVVSLYTVAQWAMPKLLQTATMAGKTPSLLVTSGKLAKDPFPAMFSLAACKAGQYSLVHSLHKQYESQGVHCGLIIIGGTVSEESKVTNPKTIADIAWKMCGKEKGKGDLEVVLEDPAFEEHIKNRER